MKSVHTDNQEFSVVIDEVNDETLGGAHLVNTVSVFHGYLVAETALPDATRLVFFDAINKQHVEVAFGIVVCHFVGHAVKTMIATGSYNHSPIAQMRHLSDTWLATSGERIVDKCSRGIVEAVKSLIGAYP